MLSSVSKACGVAKAPTAARGKAVIAKSQQRSGAALSAAAAALILIQGQPAWASGASYEASADYQAELLGLIDARTKGKAVLEVKPVENVVAVVEEAPVVKVSATMTPEERTAAIRAEALRDAKFAAGEIARTRASSSASKAAAPSSGAMLVGALAVAAAVGGAAYYQNNSTSGSPAGAQTTSGSAVSTPSPAVPEAMPQAEQREQSPAPTA